MANLFLESPATRDFDSNNLAASSNQLEQWRSFISRVSHYSDEDFSAKDIAETNLYCAIGLPGAENLDIASSINKLGYWAQLVRQNTEKWRIKFKKSPGRFNHSYAHFCMEALVTVLQLKLGVRYNLAFSEGEYNGADSRNLFLHGLLCGHGDTCVTMPALYVAIGRRLGYPLKLVETWEHVFVRWDDLPGERFNIEATSVGYVSPDDEYYTQGRYQLSEAHLRTGVFLRSLTPRQELASFLKDRAACLRDNLQIELALESMYHASLLYPRNPCINTYWAVLTMMYFIIEEMKNRGFTKRDGKAEIPIITPRHEGERWALPLAQKGLERIFKIHGIEKSLKILDFRPHIENQSYAIGTGTIVA